MTNNEATKGNPRGSSGSVAAQWALRAPELAAWARMLVNRSDVWGGYTPLAERGKILPSGQKLGSTITRPSKKDRGRRFLDEATIVRHLRGERPEHVIGLHTTSPEN